MGNRRPKEPAARAIRARAGQVIEKQREKMRRKLGSAIDGRDPEGVHDMRVASRRLRAALAVFQPWLDKREATQAGRSLRRLTQTLGRVRELDVLRLRLDELSSQASPERKIAIETIDSRIARARLRARTRMMKSFAKINLDALDTRLRELAGAPPAWALEGAEESGLDAGVPWHTPNARTSPDEPIQTLLDRLGPPITDAARAIVNTKVPAETGSREAAETLHAARIRAKKLRYQLEIVVPYTGPQGARVIDTLKGLQEHLGGFHDDSVLDDVLEENIARQAARARPLLVHELRRLRTSRRAALRRDERACRSTLEILRADGFARAVADLFTRPAVEPAPPATAPDTIPATLGTKPPEPPATEATTPSAPPPEEPSPPAGAVPSAHFGAEPVGGRYAGEPIEREAAAPPTRSAAHAAGAGSPLPRGGLPRKS